MNKSGHNKGNNKRIMFSKALDNDKVSSLWKNVEQRHCRLDKNKWDAAVSEELILGKRM